MATPQTGAGDPRRSLELLWREFGPQQNRPGPKPRLSVEQIVKAAIRLADRDGINAVNMRAVADELGVGTMTLYRYVPGKSELLDLMVDAAGDPREASPEPYSQGWRSTLERLADDSMGFFREHPWMLEVNQRRPILGPGGLAGMEYALAAFDEHDLPDGEMIQIITAVWSITTGTALSYFISDTPPELGGPVFTEEEWWAEQEPYLQRAVDSGHFPRLGAMQHYDAWEMTAQEAMRHALDAYLDGIAPRMEATRRER